MKAILGKEDQFIYLVYHRLGSSHLFLIFILTQQDTCYFYLVYYGKYEAYDKVQKNDMNPCVPVIQLPQSLVFYQLISFSDEKI